MSGYVSLARNGVRWRASADFVPRIESGPFADLQAALASGSPIKDLRHKRTVEVRESGRAWLVKIYKRGSVWRRMAAALGGTRAEHELEQSDKILGLGLPAVPVAAIAEWEDGSAVVCERLEGWISLEEELRRRPDPELLRRYGLFARRLQDAGVDQEDFNPSNILIRGDEMRLIDFERLRVGTPLGRRRRLFLLGKFVRLDTIGRKGLDPFLEGYLRPGEDHEAFLGGILRCAGRQDEIDRERLRRNCTRENRNFGRLETPLHEIWFRRPNPAVGRVGLTADQARALEDHPEGFVLRAQTDALREWRDSNVRAKDGAPIPMAVLVEKGSRRGFIAYRS